MLPERDGVTCPHPPSTLVNYNDYSVFYIPHRPAGWEATYTYERRFSYLFRVDFLRTITINTYILVGGSPSSASHIHLRHNQYSTLA